MPRTLSERQEAELGQDQACAMGYVWGWQDAGGDKVDTDVSIEFGKAWRARKRLFLTEEVTYLPNIADAYKEWRETGRIA